MHYSMVLLPEQPMQPRLFDDRVGYFSISQMDYGQDEHRAPRRRYIVRYRLEKKDPRAAMSEPVKPDQANSRGPMTFWGAAMFQWVNAKGWVMVIGTITAYAAIAAYPWNIAIQVGLSLLLGILSCTAWALFGTALRPVLTSRRAVRAFNIVMAVLLLASLYPVFMDA